MPHSQMKGSEDSVGIGRAMENTASNKTQGTPTAYYARLIDKGLASRVYHYKEPSWRSTISLKGDHAELNQGVFTPRWSETPQWVRRLRSAESNATWFSPNVFTSNLPFAEVQLYLMAHQTGKWGDIARNCHLSQCASAPCLALQPPDETTWYIALDDIMSTIAIGWPCEAVTKGGSLLCLTPREDMTWKWLPVVSDAWSACTFEWTSPLHMALERHWTWDYMINHPRIACNVVTQPKPLLQKCARQAFWNINTTGIQWYYRYLGVPKPGNKTCSIS